MTQHPQTNAPTYPSRTERGVADLDPESIEAFAKRLIGSGFVVTERGKDGRPPTLQEAKLIAHAAARYDLDPLMGEVSVLGSKLYTTLAGVRKSARNIARRSGRKYCEATRPATIDEARAANVGDTEHYWIADIIIDGGEESFRGHGFASNDNVAIAAIWRDRQLVGHDPRVIRNMAENRAVRRALVAAFGLPFADPEEAREEAPHVPATTVQAPAQGPTEVYPAIPQAAGSAPTVLVDTTPRPEPVPVERAKTAPVTYPAAGPSGAPGKRAAAAPVTSGPGPAPAPPISDAEAEEIFRREQTAAKS